MRHTLILMTAICAVFAFMAAPQSASAQCTYRMLDVGRPHGYLSGPCNGSALNYAGAYPSRAVNPNSTVKKAPRPRAIKR
jgi:hypothetical protein